jgi:RNA polymerase sigma factor (sigma-70 family)
MPLTTEQQERLWADRALVYFVADEIWRQHRTAAAHWGSREDLRQEAMLFAGQLLAGDKHDAARGGWSNFLCVCLRRRLRQALYHERLIRSATHADGPDLDRANSVRPLSHKAARSLPARATEEENVSPAELRQVMEGSLQPGQLRLVTEYYFEERTLEQIGQEMGRSRQRVHQLLRDSREQLRLALEQGLAAA